MRRVFSRAAHAAGVAIFFASSLFGTTAGAADAYPNHPIRMVVPYSAGGGSDVLARLVAKRMSDSLGQPIIIENRGGAGGIAGQTVVARAPADGYTLLFSGSGFLAMSPFLFKNLPYNTSKDFTPIALVGQTPMVMLANENAGAKSFAELKKSAAAKELSWASGGPSTPSHLSGILAFSAADLKILHVPFNGTAPAVTAFRGKQVDLIVDTLPALTPQIDHSKGIYAIAQFGTERSELLPQVPTMKELGYDVSASAWWGVLGPANLPENIRQALNQAVNTALTQPSMKELLRNMGATPTGGTPEAFSQLLGGELKKWNGIIQTAAIDKQ